MHALDCSILRPFASRITWTALLVAVVAITGCGSSGSSAPSQTTTPGEAPTITTQPANATIPLDSAATLTVGAEGTGPLTYQWTQNGNALPGATSASLTTAALQLADSGDAFTVTVTNTYGSVTSHPATITIGPRSPAPRDMRFKHVQLSSTLQGILHTNIIASIPGNMSTTSFTGDLGSPLSVGNQNCGTELGQTECAWIVNEDAAPTGVPGFNSAYEADVLSDLGGDLAALPANSVVTSLDEQNGPGFAYGEFAYSVETDPTVSGGFTLQRAQVTDTTLAAKVSALAAQGAVVTAASLNPSGGIDLVAYAWSGDQGTTYDAQAILTTYAGLGPQALILSQQGYIITAVGTADANQMLVIGTKVHGDTLPRNLYYVTTQVGSGGTSAPGQIAVGNAFGNDAGNNPNLPGYQILLTQ